MSVVSIGIAYSGLDWHLCLVDEDGRTIECLLLDDQKRALLWLAHTSSLYPEPAIGFSSHLDCALSPLPALSGCGFSSSSLSPADHSLPDFLLALSTFSHHSYCLPSLKYLSSLPLHRRVLHPVMGSSHSLCSIATLLFRMRQSEAAWTEMRFLCLDLDAWSYTITVVHDGLIVDALSSRTTASGQLASTVLEQAFWEGLTSDLAGLMAVHHFEDIVISSHTGSPEANACKDEVTQRLGDLYQFYLYPQQESLSAGFETSLGAALLVAGLSRSGPTAELASRLLAVAP